MRRTPAASRASRSARVRRRPDNALAGRARARLLDPGRPSAPGDARRRGRSRASWPGARSRTAPRGPAERTNRTRRARTRRHDGRPNALTQEVRRQTDCDRDAPALHRLPAPAGAAACMMEGILPSRGGVFRRHTLGVGAAFLGCAARPPARSWRQTSRPTSAPAIASWRSDPLPLRRPSAAAEAVFPHPLRAARRGSGLRSTPAPRWRAERAIRTRPRARRSRRHRVM